ncbi:hypothetical protein D4Q76_00160 [archaeon]|nr:MAG: hypothetical protein D4Q76_00160 [archaeon]
MSNPLKLLKKPELSDYIERVKKLSADNQKVFIDSYFKSNGNLIQTYFWIAITTLVAIFSFINIFRDLSLLVVMIAGLFVLVIFIQYTLVTFLRKDLDTLIDFLEVSEKKKGK